MNLKTQVIKFHVARIHRQTGVTQIVTQEGYNELYRETQRLNDSDGYETVQDANIVAQSLNRPSEHFGQNYFYFVIRSLSDNTVISNNFPEDILNLFENGDGEPEEDVTEPDAPEPEAPDEEA